MELSVRCPSNHHLQGLHSNILLTLHISECSEDVVAEGFDENGVDGMEISTNIRERDREMTRTVKRGFTEKKTIDLSMILLIQKSIELKLDQIAQFGFIIIRKSSRNEKFVLGFAPCGTGYAGEETM